MSNLKGEGPSPPVSIAPKSFPVGPLMTVPVLGRPSPEESYLPLANPSCTGGQAGWSKVGRGGAPAREIHFVSSVAYGSKVSQSALAMGVYSFWNQAGWFPTSIYPLPRVFTNCFLLPSAFQNLSAPETPRFCPTSFLLPISITRKPSLVLLGYNIQKV